MLFQQGFEVFAKIAENKSFREAAKALNQSNASVSKHLKLLEEKLGVVLVNRTTRSVVLTEAGEKIAEMLKRNSEDYFSVIEEISEGRERVVGRLRINAPMAFGEKFLSEPIAEFAKLYPELILDVEFDDRRVHIVEEGYDLVIRIGKLEDSGLVARKLCDFDTVVCANSEFLERYDYPDKPEKLKNLPAVIYSYSSRGLHINFQDTEGKEYVLTSTPAIFANSMGMLLASVSSGIGYGILPRVFCRDSILQGKFKEILKEYKVYPEWGIFAIYPERRYLPIKVTKFIEHLKYNLRNRPKELYFPC